MGLSATDFDRVGLGAAFAIAALLTGMAASGLPARPALRRGWWWLPPAAGAGMVYLAARHDLWPGVVAAGALLAGALAWSCDRRSLIPLAVSTGLVIPAAEASMHLDALATGTGVMAVLGLGLAWLNLQAAGAASTAQPAVRALYLGLLGLVTLAFGLAPLLLHGGQPNLRTAWLAAAVWLPPLVQTTLVEQDRRFGTDAFHGRSCCLLAILLLGALSP